MTLGAALFATVLFTPSLGAAQDVTLRAPDAVLKAEFSQVRGVRELKDGRILVADRLDEKVWVADFTTGRQQSIGRTGAGPLEFHLPSGLSPMPGDSTLLVDEGNSRLAVIGPDAKIARSFVVRIPGIGFALGARAVDTRGRYYLAIPGWLINAAQRGDSVPVVRFDPAANRVDTIAIILGMRSPKNRDGRVMGFSFEAFAAQDTWTATNTGSVAIVRSGDFHVEWLDPAGRVTRGAAVPFERVPVTMADKMAFVRSFVSNSPMSGKGEGGTMGTTPAEFQSDENVRRMVAANSFAEFKAPFTSNAPLLGADGTLWVERGVPLGAAGWWDVFDASGKRLRTVVLPKDRRLVALGRGVAYLVAEGDDGTQRVERYRL